MNQSTNPLALLANSRPSSAAVQEEKRRQNQAPAIANAQTTAEQALLTPPVGAMIMWPGAAAPADGKWLLCEGQTLNQFDFPDLFAVVGHAYGSNIAYDTTNQFVLPDLRSRMPVGAGQGLGQTNRSLGERGGASLHQLSTSEMPSHGHSVSESTATHNHDNDGDGLGGSTTSNGGHSHSGDNYATATTRYVSSVAPLNYVCVWYLTSQSGNTNSVTDHSHSLKINSNTHKHDVSVGSAGSGLSHNNMPPFLGVNYIIRALA